LKIINSKQFILDFVKYNLIYTIVCTSVTKTSNKKLTKSKIFKKLKNLKGICNSKLIRILLQLKKENYIIKFQDNKELSFIFLYNFYKTN